MSERQHTADIEAKLPHVKAGGTEGGQCLNRHQGRTNDNSCSHQWQAYKKTQDKRSLYNGKHENAGGAIRAFRTQNGFEFREMPGPKPGEWDVDVSNPNHHGIKNFAESSSVPYYHEAHHVVPNSTLNGTIQDLFSANGAVLLAVRRGLLEEGYNLNHKDNMIILPLDVAVSKAIKLPRHREFNVFGHAAYSAKVKAKVKKCFNANKQAIDGHEKPKYVACKQQIVDLSVALFDKIVAAGAMGASKLDEMTPGQMKGV